MLDWMRYRRDLAEFAFQTFIFTLPGSLYPRDFWQYHYSSARFLLWLGVKAFPGNEKP